MPQRTSIQTAINQVFVPRWYDKLIVWMCCNVLFFFIPFLAPIVRENLNIAIPNYTDMIQKIWDFFGTFDQNKEVLMVCIAILMDALGSMYLSKRNTATLSLSLACLIFLVISTFFYATVHVPTYLIVLTFLVSAFITTMTKLVL